MVNWFLTEVQRQFSVLLNSQGTFDHQEMMLGQWATDMNLNPHLIPYTKINPKWIKDLNIKAKTIKLPEENKGVDLYDVVLGKEFFAFLEETKKKISKRKKISKFPLSKF